MEPKHFQEKNTFIMMFLFELESKNYVFFERMLIFQP